MTTSFVERAYLAACGDELDALKPGNVHRFNPGHGMTVADFEAAAAASAPPLARPGTGLGERIFQAVEASRAAVPVNTNLGIVLLCAPLAQSVLDFGAPSSVTNLRANLAKVIGGTTVEDAEWTFRAIALAAPGGLGEVPEHDVRSPATVNLLEAMEEAADRDMIARQYVNRFAEVFDIGIVRLARDRPSKQAVTHAYLGFLSGFPDSHIARKFGDAVAARVMAEAAEFDRDREAACDVDRLARFDRRLKRDGLNPGTSADLTVAALFARHLCILS